MYFLKFKFESNVKNFNWKELNVMINFILFILFYFIDHSLLEK